MNQLPRSERVAGLSRWHQVVQEAGENNTTLAKRFGVSRQTVARWAEPDSKGSPALYLIEFCDEHDISLTWLSFGIGPKHMSELKEMMEVYEHFDDNKNLIAAVLAENNRLAELLDRLAPLLERLENIG